MSAAAGAAAAAAAARQAKMREEEEHTLTTYSNQDLNGWEFKIVRSVTKITGDKFKQLCNEEARNGWELVENLTTTAFALSDLSSADRVTALTHLTHIAPSMG